MYRVKISVYLLSIVFLISCENINSIEDEVINIDSTIKEKIHIEELDSMDYLLHNKIIKNLNHSYHLEKEENFLFDDSQLIIKLNDSIDVIKIPIINESGRFYLLTVVSDYEVYSYFKVKSSWLDNDETTFHERLKLIEEPYCELLDLNQDGYLELLIKDRQNIGNVYEAAITHVFLINDFKLKYTGGFEYISYLPFDEQYLVRKWDYKNNKVDVFLMDSLASKNNIRIGDFFLSIRKDTLVYKNINILSEYIYLEGALISTK